MSRDNLILRLILAVGIHYPILVECGLRLTRILTIIVPEGCTQTVLDILDSVLCKRLSPMASKSEVRATFYAMSSGLVLIPGVKSPKTYKMLNYVYALFLTGRIDERPILALPVVVTEDSTINDEEMQRYYVFLNAPPSSGTLPLKELVPPMEEVPSIIQRIKTLDSILGVEKCVLIAASWFLPSEHWPQYVPLVDQICESEEQCRDAYDLDERFIAMLNDWQKKVEFTNVFAVNGIVSELDEAKTGGVFYSGEYIYIPEALFSLIVQPITQEGVSILTLKSALREQELLCPGRNSRSYTVKITVLNEEAQPVRIRAMRFERKKLREPGERELIDACRARARRKRSANA